MPRYHFLQLDVFTTHPFGGNQLAVFTDARRLEPAQMQALAREMNFSETTFVFPPTSGGTAAKVRIFTPATELPMAGHPTVGTTAALVHTGLAHPVGGALVLELGIGPVRVDVEPLDASPSGGQLPFVWMTHRPPVFGPRRADRGAVAQALGLSEGDLIPDLPLEVVSTGLPFLFVPVASLEVIGRARSEISALAALFAGREPAHVGLFTTQVVDPAARFHVRMYSPHLAGIVEDPATGSMAAPFGAYAARYGLLPQAETAEFTLEQGLEMGRPSQIRVSVTGAPRNEDTGQLANPADWANCLIRIGGDSVLVGEGHIFWE